MSQPAAADLAAPRNGVERGEAPLLLDVRTPAEFREVHIPGSVNVPLGDLAERSGEVLSLAAGRCITLVCRTGRRAETARVCLGEAGAWSLEVLEGGVAAWTEAGRPVRRGKKAVSLERQVRIAAGALVVLGAALGLFLHPGFLALPAFVGAGLVLSGVTDTCGMAMVLARMPWNRASACPEA